MGFLRASEIRATNGPTIITLQPLEFRPWSCNLIDHAVRALRCEIMPEVDLEPNYLESERAWFADYYREEHVNPIGMGLRVRRDLANALKHSGRRTLGRVLSIGCGDGRFERLLAPSAESVVGIDISPDAISIANAIAARDGLTNLKFQVKTTDEFDWNGPFDTVFCMALFHHLPEGEVPGLASRIYQNLERGGLLFTLDPNADAVMRKIGRIILGGRYHNYHTDDERELSPSDTRAIICRSGFDRVDYLPADWTLIPAMYILSQGPQWPLRRCDWVDRLCFRLPIDRWASRFSLAAHKD